jgi:hypothetical protein
MAADEAICGEVLPQPKPSYVRMSTASPCVKIKNFAATGSASVLSAMAVRDR